MSEIDFLNANGYFDKKSEINIHLCALNGSCYPASCSFMFKEVGGMIGGTHLSFLAALFLVQIFAIVNSVNNVSFEV